MACSLYLLLMSVGGVQTPPLALDLTALLCPTLLQAPAPQAAAETPPPQERVCLNLVTDKEWQRLFAVLTISGQPKRAGEYDSNQQQQQANADNTASGTSNTAATTAAAVEVAPATPSRSETASQAAIVAPEAATPKRSSFLLTEFTRVQARLTPERQIHQQPSSSYMEVMG